jgi:diadenylate cyclase
MPQLIEPILDQIRPTTLLDIGIVALLIYWLFSLIRGTRAVTLVIGVSMLFLVYALAQAIGLRLLTQIMQTGAVVGVFALVVVFQPELRRALERIGRVGSFQWLLAPADRRTVEHVAHEVSHAAGALAATGVGALIVLERETGLGEIAESGVGLDAEISTDLLLTVFTPRTALHDGAVIIRGDRILAAGAVLPLAEITVQSQRFGTRHRAALGITEQTDALVVVVSEENHKISLVERGRIVRAMSEPQLARALRSMLDPTVGRRSRLPWAGRSGRGTGSDPASPTSPAGSSGPPSRPGPASPTPPTSSDRAAASGTPAPTEPGGLGTEPSGPGLSSASATPPSGGSESDGATRIGHGDVTGSTSGGAR